RAILLDKANWMRSLESANLFASPIRGTVIDEQNFPKRYSTRSNLRHQWRDIFLLVQGRNDDRDGLGCCREICHFGSRFIKTPNVQRSTSNVHHRIANNPQSAIRNREPATP